MRVRMAALLACILLLSGSVVWHGLTAQETATAEKKPAKRNQALLVVPTAKAFVATLDPQARSKALLDFDTEKRVQWHFIPMDTRKGLPIMEMNSEQKDAAMKLLRSVLSKTGYDKATVIMALESVLRKLEGPNANERNPEKYYFTIFGTPKQKARWGLSIEGHHLSLNFVFEGSKFLDSTPQFFAANPAELKEDYGDQFPKGLRVLRAEEQLAFQLVKSLDKAQMAQAQLPGETPREIRGAGEPQPPTEALQGLVAADMSEQQRDPEENHAGLYFEDEASSGQTSMGED